MTVKLNAVPATKGEIIRTAYDLYLSGHTADEIADAFNAAGVLVIHPATPRRPFRAPALKHLAQGPVTD
ncbi:hypothetical protein [Streptomyces qinglanensis]|uniref:hypothetical protein n=1 Tax=Streptomyces qinglanensis TaxID=943816 RepID=UPI003D759275